jgi:hypothetical protein
VTTLLPVHKVAVEAVEAVEALVKVDRELLAAAAVPVVKVVRADAVAPLVKVVRADAVVPVAMARTAGVLASPERLEYWGASHQSRQLVQLVLQEQHHSRHLLGVQAH